MDIFISYAGADKRCAVRLKELLGQRGHSAFVAERSISPGSEWSRTIRSRVVNCDLFVILDSDDSRVSPWVQQETGMAMASGRVVIPVALTGSTTNLPGWLSGLQAVRSDSYRGFEAEASTIVERLLDGAIRRTDAMPRVLREPQSLVEFVLRVLFLDQFDSSGSHSGAWSRQYDQYLKTYYDSVIGRDISQTASLTFTGINVTRLAKLVQETESLAPTIQPMVEQAVKFILASREEEGGFGKIASTPKARGGYGVEMDLRHSCWAVNALLAIDPTKFSDEILTGFNWILQRARQDLKKDRWCWTTSAFLLLMSNASIPHLVSHGDHLALSAKAAFQLEKSFCPRLGSWVKEEPAEVRELIWVDNALHILGNIVSISQRYPQLEQQMEVSLDRLLGAVVTTGNGAAGLPLFARDSPSVGATAQLLHILEKFSKELDPSLVEFVIKGVADPDALQETYSWHLSAALSINALTSR